MNIYDFEKAIESLGDIFGKTWNKSLTDKVYKENYINNKNKEIVIDVINRLTLDAEKAPTPKKFIKALNLKERSLRNTAPRRACEICGGSGLLSMVIYTDLDRYQYQMPGEPTPEWYARLPSQGKQPVTTKAVRCKCGRNRNPGIKSYAEVVQG